MQQENQKIFDFFTNKLITICAMISQSICFGGYCFYVFGRVFALACVICIIGTYTVVFLAERVQPFRAQKQELNKVN